MYCDVRHCGTAALLDLVVLVEFEALNGEISFHVRLLLLKVTCY